MDFCLLLYFLNFLAVCWHQRRHDSCSENEFAANLVQTSISEYRAKFKVAKEEITCHSSQPWMPNFVSDLDITLNSTIFISSWTRKLNQPEVLISAEPPITLSCSSTVYFPYPNLTARHSHSFFNSVTSRVPPFYGVSLCYARLQVCKCNKRNMYPLYVSDNGGCCHIEEWGYLWVLFSYSMGTCTCLDRNPNIPIILFLNPDGMLFLKTEHSWQITY